MMKAKVVKASSQATLEEKINSVLSHVGDQFVDMKFAGTFDGEDDIYVAIILYK